MGNQFGIPGWPYKKSGKPEPDDPEWNEFRRRQVYDLLLKVYVSPDLSNRIKREILKKKYPFKNLYMNFWINLSCDPASAEWSSNFIFGSLKKSVGEK